MTSCLSIKFSEGRFICVLCLFVAYPYSKDLPLMTKQTLEVQRPLKECQSPAIIWWCDSWALLKTHNLYGKKNTHSTKIVEYWTFHSTKCHFGNSWVFPKMVVPPFHTPKWIIFSRKTPWLFGTTNLRPTVGGSRPWWCALHTSTVQSSTSPRCGLACGSEVKAR